MFCDLLLRDGEVMTPGGLIRADIAVKNGKIIQIAPTIDADAAEVMSLSGLTVLPGVIDTQVHFREPGLTHKEDLATGSLAAVLGGVTSVFEMPNTQPPTIDAQQFHDKIQRATDRMYCHFAFFVGATPDNSEALSTLERQQGCAGVKVFMGSSTGSLLLEDPQALIATLRHTRRRISVHAEDETTLRQDKHLATSVAAHPQARSETAALRATQQLLEAARLTGRSVHVLHISSAAELDLLAANKDIASVEATPQHLTLAAPDCYAELGTFAQMNPPIRARRHQEALWAAVRSGVVDIIGSDHAPHTRMEKEQAYPASPSGMPGVQTLLPVMLDHVAQGRLSLERLVDLTASAPQRLFAIRNKGRIVVGYDADLVVVDRKRRQALSDCPMIGSKCGWSPFSQTPLTGWPVATIVSGHVIVRDGHLCHNPDAAPPPGKPIAFDYC